MAAQIYLYLGGTRSGKSEKAEACVYDIMAKTGCAIAQNSMVLYVATAQNTFDDASMDLRIERHKERRPSSWHTLECACDLGKNISLYLENSCALVSSQKSIQNENIKNRKQIIVLVDCVTMWITHLLCTNQDKATLNNTSVLNNTLNLEEQRIYEENASSFFDVVALEKRVKKEIDDLLNIIKSYENKVNVDFSWVLVSGEVGLGGIHASKIERVFADLLGMANQMLARYAHEVYLIAAGRSLRLE